MLRRGSVDRLGLVALAMSAVLGCTSATPATPSPSALTSPAASASVPSLVTLAPASPGATATAAAPSTAPQSEAPQTPTSASPPPASPTAPPSTPPSATPTPSPLRLDWQRQGNPGMGSAEDIYASAASGNRVVAIGDDWNINPVIWTTTDGRNWTLGDLSFIPTNSELNDVSAFQYGFIVVGYDEFNDQQLPLIMKSNDGRTWEHDEQYDLADGNFYNVASVGATTVIYGDSKGQSGFLVSHDGGLTWGQFGDPDGVTKYGLQDLIATNNALWAFTPASGANKAPIEIWRSDDGDSWTSMGTIAGSAGAEDLQVVQGPLGWVALADNTQKLKQVNYAWWSADGINWQAAQNPPFAFSDIFADDTGFIVVGKWLPKPSGCAIDEAEYAGVSWTSVDGLLWTRMPDEGWQSRWIEQLRRYGRTLIGIGIDYSGADDTGKGAIWTAKLPSLAANNGPVPSNPPSPTGGGCGP